LSQKTGILEIYRWGFASLPGILFFYANELELEIEDLGVLAAIFYTLERTRPLYQTGIQLGQVLQVCNCLTKNKLSRRINKFTELGLVETISEGKSFAEKRISLSPLIDRLEALVIRDHPHITADCVSGEKPNPQPVETLLQEYQEKIEQLELKLEEKSKIPKAGVHVNSKSASYKKVADFISKKTGNLISVRMSTELRKWLEELQFSPEFLLCMLEMCFERNITHPHEITRIAKDLREYSINTVEGLESYFLAYVDKDSKKALRFKEFDPDIIEFGKFTGISMEADARKEVYYKWRYDWGFSHQMIMKAGEIMCQRTQNGGLEYIDSVLYNWMTKEIRLVEEAEKEIMRFKAKSKGAKSNSKGSGYKTNIPEYEIYVPKSSLEELKTK
jgi:DNA replication protein DnaD